ncbi:MAG: carboxypeptidase-like regulatory domain-containing protein [bacterium]|nr:carboxypeptidase-like regulatory domain-containing protein [bacterium]
MINSKFIKTIFLFINIIILSVVNINCQRSSKGKITKNYGIKGTVTFQGKPTDWAFVYLYTDEDTNYKKQYASISEATRRDGQYTISPKPGKYFILARKRWNYASTGPLRVGDYQVLHNQNPITVEENKWLEINLDLEEIKSESSVNSPKNTGIKGKIVSKDTDMEGTFLYAYINNDTDLRGPSYYALIKPDKSGIFTLDLPEGKYYITVRKRLNKDKFGGLKTGDLNTDYQNNPVEVKINNYTNLEDIVLGKIDPVKLKSIESGEIKAKTQTIIRGTIKDSSGQPKEGVYAFVYQDSQMIGKPLYRSVVTGKNGNYELFLSRGGNYYVGARNTFGGPLAPGDLVGAYDGTPEHILTIKDAEIKDNIDITVEEFY